MERKIIVCACHSLEHQIAFYYDSEEKLLYLYPHLVTHRGFFSRLCYGLKYAFGYKSRFGAWDEIIIDQADQQKLIEYIKDSKKEPISNNYESKTD
jgi:hypothetical protein